MSPYRTSAPRPPPRTPWRCRWGLHRLVRLGWTRDYFPREVAACTDCGRRWQHDYHAEGVDVVELAEDEHLELTEEEEAC